LNFDGIEFPIKRKDINKFEKQNAEISVNFLGYENKNVFLLGISKSSEGTELMDREHGS